MTRWLLLLVGACGGADIGDGTIQCSVSGDCPSGFTCRSDRACYRIGTADAAPGGAGDGSGAPCPTEGAECAPPECAAWSDCAGFVDACDQDGLQERSCRISTCTQGACLAHDEPETQVCTRDTNGQTCAPATCGAWDHQDLDCSPGCADERTCTDSACQDGVCDPTSRIETGTCVSFERCGSYVCSCGTFDRVCDAGGACVIPESCTSLCF